LASSVETAARCLRLCQRGFHAHAAALAGGRGVAGKRDAFGGWDAGLEAVKRVADALAGSGEEARWLEASRGAVDGRDVVDVDGYVDYAVGRRAGVGGERGGAGGARVAYFEARAFEEAPGGASGAPPGEEEGDGDLVALLCREPSVGQGVEGLGGLAVGFGGVLPEVGDAEVEAAVREGRGWDGSGVVGAWEGEGGGDEAMGVSGDGEAGAWVGDIEGMDGAAFDDVDAMVRGPDGGAVPPQWETCRAAGGDATGRRLGAGDASVATAAARQPMLSGHGVGLAMAELQARVRGDKALEGVRGDAADEGDGDGEEERAEADLVRRCLLATCGVPSRAFDHLVFEGAPAAGAGTKLGALRPRLPTSRGLRSVGRALSRGGGVSRRTLGSCLGEFARAGSAALSLEYAGAALASAPGHVARALGSAVAQYLQVFRAAVLQAAGAAARRRGEALPAGWASASGPMADLGSMSTLEALSHTRALRAQVRAVDAIVRAVLEASVPAEGPAEAPQARVRVEGRGGDLSEFLETLAAFSPAVARLAQASSSSEWAGSGGGGIGSVGAGTPAFLGARALDVLHAQLQVCGRDPLTAPVVRALFVTVARPMLHHVHCWTTQVRVEDVFREFPLSTGPNPPRDAACPPAVVPGGGHAWWISRLHEAGPQASPSALPHVLRGVAHEVLGCGRSMSLLFAHPRTRELAAFVAASAPPLGLAADAVSAATFRGPGASASKHHGQYARLARLQSDFSEAAEAELARLSSQIAMERAQELAQRAGAAARLQKSLEDEDREEASSGQASGDEAEVGAANGEGGPAMGSKRLRRLSEAAALAESEAEYWRTIVEERTRSLHAVQRKIKGQRWLQLRAMHDQERTALWKSDRAQWRAELLRVQKEQEDLDRAEDGLVARLSRGDTSSPAGITAALADATPSQKMAAAGVSAGQVLSSSVAVKNEGTVQGERGSASGGGSGVRAKSLLYPDARPEELKDVLSAEQLQPGAETVAPRAVDAHTDILGAGDVVAQSAEEVVEAIVKDLIDVVLEGEGDEGDGNLTNIPESAQHASGLAEEPLVSSASADAETTSVAAFAADAGVDGAGEASLLAMVDGRAAPTLPTSRKSAVEVQDSPVEALLSLSVERIVLSVSRVADKGCALLLLRRCSLRDHLAAMRRYLLFAAGDFADSFCDGLFGGTASLQLPSVTLQHLVDDSVGQSVWRSDPLARALKAHNSKHRAMESEGKGSERYAGSGMGMTELLMGGDDDNDDDDGNGPFRDSATRLEHAFGDVTVDERRSGAGQRSAKENLDDYDYVTLGYDAEWPLSIVLSTEKCVDGYARVFRFLLRLARMRTVLRDLYAQTSALAGGRTGELDWAKQRSCVLFRHEVQHFISILHAYLMSQVVDVSWSELSAQIDALEDELLQEEVGGPRRGRAGAHAPAPSGADAGACFVERLVHVHEAYLARMKQRCLLDPEQRPVRLLIEDTFQRLLDFRTQLERDLAGGASATETYRNVYRMHSAFRRNTEFLYQVLAKVAGESGGKGVAHVRDLLVRLNYNEFFQDA